MNLKARLRIGLAVGATSATLVTALGSTAPAASSPGGTQGVNPQLPDTPSKVVVSGRGVYANVKVTVNQTRSLVNQAIGVSWTGAPSTLTNNQPYFNGTVDSNFFAIFQCWGDPTDLVSSGNPGPPPSQCEVGASASSNKPYPVEQNFTLPLDASSRVLDRGSSSPTYQQDLQSGGYLDSGSGWVFEPFRSVNGKVVNVPENPNALENPQLGLQFWNRDMPFSINNTNEIDYAHTFPDGTGSELFQVDTGLEASGLGCGQHTEPAGPGGSTRIPQCWLVIVPQPSSSSSPLKPSVWQNRIAIPLDLNSVDSPCPIGADARAVEGGEMASLAIHSWQPSLCTAPGNPPYNYTVLSDDRARQDLSLGSTPGSATMSVASVPGATTDGSTPVWAPLTLSGVVIGLNIDRVSALQSDGTYYPDQIPIIGSRIKTINLTPRLVAKLITESYLGQFVGLNPSSPPTGYSWLADAGTHFHNPAGLFDDPDFVQFNPEFAELSTYYGVTASQAIVELGSSDASSVLWQWVLSDPEASAWLAGSPDQWGMRVNPLYSTNPRLNPTGVPFGTPTPSQFQKNDQYCQAPPDYPINGQLPYPACMLNWSPYALNMASAAQETRSSNDGARTTLPDQQLGITVSNFWQADGPEATGEQFMLSVTDSASAARYGLQSARLSQAGDDRPLREFIAPDDSNSNSLLAGLQAMSPSQQVPGTLIPNVGSAASGAYPLTMLSYAAVVPSELDSSARHDYANFITYAATQGQTPGNGFGQLPPGYVPLPPALQQQALAAAASILAAPTPNKPATGGSSPVSTPMRPVGAPPVTFATVPTSQTPVSTAPPSSFPSVISQVREQPQSAAHKRTPRTSVGFVRLGLPIGAGVGALAALAAPLTGRRKRDGGASFQ